MRTLFFLTVITAIATTAYFYGPHLFGSDTPQNPMAWVPSLGTGDQDAVSAGLEHVKQEASTPQVMKPAPAAQAEPETAPRLRRKTSSRKAPNNLPAAPAWAADTNTKPQVQKIDSQNPAAVAKEERNFSDPMKNRWINDLSGHKVNVSFAKGRVKDGCEFELDQCEKIRKTEDAKLVGVIVKTRRLVDNPTRALDGSLRSGHYAKGTPALYID